MSVIHVLVSLWVLEVYNKKLLNLPVCTLLHVLFSFPSSVFSFCFFRNVNFLWKCGEKKKKSRNFSLPAPFQPPPLLSPFSRCDSSHISMHSVHAFYYPSGLKWCLSIVCESLTEFCALPHVLQLLIKYSLGRKEKQKNLSSQM